MAHSPSDTSPSTRWLFPLLTLLFFGSGFAALTYQVMWLRMLSLVFGVTVYAASTVLAGFMAGLALGSYAAGRLAGRAHRPLQWFGVAEIGVGLSALASPLILDGLMTGYLALAPSLPDSVALLTLLRFLGAFVVLIVPTALMGSTLPLVVQSAMAKAEGFGPREGVLYATNTAGAIVGSLIGGFYLISEVGVSGSLQLAASVNGLIGLIAIAAARMLPTVDDAAEGPASSAPEAPAVTEAVATTAAPVAARAGYALLIASAVSGFASLALEVVWFRMLAVYLRPTAYAFTIMLAAVLFGLAIGSYAAAALLRRRRTPWLALLTVLQAALTLTTVLSFNTLARSQAALDALAPTLASVGIDEYLWPLIASSLAAILPSALLFGLAFPVGLRAWTSEGDAAETSRRVGVFYAVNVCGAIAGSVLSGFVLLPLFGSRGSLIAIATALLVSAVLLAARQYRSRPDFAGFAALVTPVAFGMAALNAVDPFDVALERFHRGERELWRMEGIQTTVSVNEAPTRSGPMRVMYLDGNHQANDSATMSFVHHRIGALPVMLHRQPTRVLVVGLGGGATAGAAARFPGVQVDVIELSDAVVAGARWFERINFGLLRRPNVSLRVDDGRNFLMTTTRKYDVITADLILPRHAGATSLYSHEYYALARRALAPGGVMLQWVGGETEQEFKLQARTFQQVFPETTVWGDGTLLLGSTVPFTLSQQAFERRRDDPEFRALFDWDLATMRRLYVAGPGSLRQFVGPGPVLSDDRPVIEYFLSLPKNAPPVDLSTLRVGSLDEVLVP